MNDRIKPKADEDRLLTDEEEVAALQRVTHGELNCTYNQSIAKAQRDLTAAAKDREWADHLKVWAQMLDDTYQAKLEQVFAELTEGLGMGSINPHGWEYEVRSINIAWWQALKEKWLKEGA